MDGNADYNRLTQPGCNGGAQIRLAYYWSHTKRRLREIYDSSGSEIAAVGLRRIAELYAIEVEIRGSTPASRPSLGTAAKNCFRNSLFCRILEDELLRSEHNGTDARHQPLFHVISCHAFARR